MNDKKSLVGALEELINRVDAMDDSEIVAVAGALTELEGIPLVQNSRVNKEAA